LDRIDRLRVGSCQGRGAQQRLARLSRKCSDACPHQRVEILRDGNAAREVALALAVQLAPDLDRIERVAAGRLGDSHERRSRKCASELLREHAVKSGDGKRSQFEVLKLEVALERGNGRLRKLRRAHREEALYGLLAESAQRKPDRG